MSGFRMYEKEYPHFLTLTLVEWMPLFRWPQYQRVVIDSLRFCQREKGLRIHTYVLMLDHLHLLASCDQDLSKVIGQLKSFTSCEISGLLRAENRRLSIWLAKDAARKQGEGDHKIWQDGNHPEQVYSQAFCEQKIQYIHENPVRIDLVAEPHYWLHSSAAFYSGMGPCELDIEPIPW